MYPYNQAHAVFVNQLPYTATKADIAKVRPGPPGRLSALSTSHSKSTLYGVFAWA
jgi:hypothetical protein